MRAALFDVGGTLMGSSVNDPWRPGVLRAIEKEFGKRPWAEPLYHAADFRRPPADDPHRQETNRWIAEWLVANGTPLTDDEVERLRVAFTTFPESGLGLLPGAGDALRWCKNRGLSVAVVTNTISRGDVEIRKEWERLGVSDAIDHVVSSYSTGWMKPHPAMFERALQLAGVGPDEAFMVGDDYVLDVVGAKELGIRAVLKGARDAVPSDAVHVPDAVIGSMVELPAAVERWL